MNKFIITAVCAVMALSLVGCGNTDEKSSSQPEVTPVVTPAPESSEPDVQIPNPIKTFETLEELRSSLSFAFTVPAFVPKGYEVEQLSIIDETLVSIDCKNGDDAINYRVSQGIDDISGDFNSYEVEGTINIDDIIVATKGNVENEISVATFTNEGLTYSLTFKEKGLDTETVTSIVESIFVA